MSEAHANQPELPNLVSIIASRLHDEHLAHLLEAWSNVIFSLIAIGLLTLIAILVTRKGKFIPTRVQVIFEVFVQGLSDFICGILGPKGKRFVPFIGTLFIYILFMNLFGLIPFMKSPTASWSTTLALALCVFVYVQYTSIREQGIIGYIDHLMGKPRGIVACTIFIPILIFFLEFLSQFVRPFSLSLRLRGNIWGDDLLLAIFSSMGFKALPLLLFNSFLVLLAGIIQAAVFCLLATIYFALAMPQEEH
jgi:F-type H+-transporting ATPase subunit a